MKQKLWNENLGTRPGNKNLGMRSCKWEPGNENKNLGMRTWEWEPWNNVVVFTKRYLKKGVLKIYVQQFDYCSEECLNITTSALSAILLTKSPVQGVPPQTTTPEPAMLNFEQAVRHPTLFLKPGSTLSQYCIPRQPHWHRSFITRSGGVPPVRARQGGRQEPSSGYLKLRVSY